MQSKFSQCVTKHGINGRERVQGESGKGPLQAWSHKAVLWLPVRFSGKDTLLNMKFVANMMPWAKRAKANCLTFPGSGPGNIYNLE